MSYQAQKGKGYQKERPRTWTPRKNFGTPMHQPSFPQGLKGPLLSHLQRHDLDKEAEEHKKEAVIHDCVIVASYNWMDMKGKSSTILIPGKPPRWTPPRGETKLTEDQGQYFRDKNAARWPRHPLEPVVVSCLTVNPDLPGAIDVVACGSTIGNLLRFAQGKDVPFRMLVEKVGNAVFFTRREGSPTELIPGVRGFGHTFPEAYTSWEPEVRGSASHQRIIQYTFGGLEFLVRFEADGYLRSQQASGSSKVSQTATAEKPPTADITADEISALLADAAAISPQQATHTPGSALEVRTGGSLVPQSRILQLRTRSIRTLDTDHLAEELPRLWVSQIPNYVLAFHRAGRFAEGDIRVRNVENDVRRWERDHRDDLAALAVLFRRIIALVSSSDGRLEVCHEVMGRLDVRRQLPDAGEVLSAGVRARWERASFADQASNLGVCDSNDSEPPTSKESDGVVPPGEKEWDEVSPLAWEEDDKDYTACDKECGYCGRCGY